MISYLDGQTGRPSGELVKKSSHYGETSTSKGLKQTPGFPCYWRRIEDFSSRSLHASFSLLPSRIERNADTIIASITKKPIPKNAQNRTSSMAAPFPLRKDWNVRPCVAWDQTFMFRFALLYLSHAGLVKEDDRAESGLLFESGTLFWNPTYTFHRIA